MSRNCSRNVQECPGKIREISQKKIGKCLGNVQEFRRKCPGNVRDISGKNPGQFRKCPVNCLKKYRNVQEIFRKIPGSVQNVPRNLCFVWKILACSFFFPEKIVEISRNVWKFLELALEISTKNLKIFRTDGRTVFVHLNSKKMLMFLSFFVVFPCCVLVFPCVFLFVLGFSPKLQYLY